jgi:hypothetical protein
VRSAHVALGAAIETLPDAVEQLQRAAQQRADEIVASATDQAGEIRAQAERDAKAILDAHAQKKKELAEARIRNETLELEFYALQGKVVEAHATVDLAKAQHDRIQQIIAETKAKFRES